MLLTAMLLLLLLLLWCCNGQDDNVLEAAVVATEMGTGLATGLFGGKPDRASSQRLRGSVGAGTVDARRRTGTYLPARNWAMEFSWWAATSSSGPNRCQK